MTLTRHAQSRRGSSGITCQQRHDPPADVLREFAYFLNSAKDSVRFRVLLDEDVHPETRPPLLIVLPNSSEIARRDVMQHSGKENGIEGPESRSPIAAGVHRLVGRRLPGHDTISLRSH